MYGVSDWAAPNTLWFQMLDYLAIAVHELSSMSERRIDRLMNPGRHAERTNSKSRTRGECLCSLCN